MPIAFQRTDRGHHPDHAAASLSDRRLDAGLQRDNGQGSCGTDGLRRHRRRGIASNHQGFRPSLGQGPGDRHAALTEKNLFVMFFLYQFARQIGNPRFFCRLLQRRQHTMCIGTGLRHQIEQRYAA